MGTVRDFMDFFFDGHRGEHPPPEFWLTGFLQAKSFTLGLQQFMEKQGAKKLKKNYIFEKRKHQASFTA